MISNLKNYFSNNTGLLIRIDDVAENMSWKMMDKLELLFDEHKIKPILGVIPNNQDKELLMFPKKDNFWEKVQEWKKKKWEISMHGFSHIYENNTKKKDYFGHGGNSEFYGHPYEVQSLKIKKGLKIFTEKNIKIKSFFAPNHTYDLNTFRALKEAEIFEVIDGYGLMPYVENNITFIPQLFHKVMILPFGIQTTQIHVNTWSNSDFEKFEKFLKKNIKKIITYDEALKKVNNLFFYKIIKTITEKILRLKRAI
tara:strand:- start:219 stop:980 length:762 start_codon:yes stop_codon:yes gene_type:complete